jgi:UDP-N-acetylenolpyruvoylglucosamine reductase
MKTQSKLPKRFYIQKNFILNLDDATAQDVLSLVHHIQAHVKRERGVDLEMEVQLLEF